MVRRVLIRHLSSAIVVKLNRSTFSYRRVLVPKMAQNARGNFQKTCFLTTVKSIWMQILRTQQIRIPRQTGYSKLASYEEKESELTKWPQYVGSQKPDDQNSYSFWLSGKEIYSDFFRLFSKNLTI